MCAWSTLSITIAINYLTLPWSQFCGLRNLAAFWKGLPDDVSKPHATA